MSEPTQRPTAHDYGELLWLVAAWEARFAGFHGRIQDALCKAVPDCDADALLEANRYPYLNRPDTDKPGWLRDAEVEAAR